MKAKRDIPGNKEQGQSLVEFALLVPVFLVLLMSVLEFSQLWMTMNLLTGAAREGARVAAVTAPDAARVQDAVNQVLNPANIRNANVIISGPNAARQVSVTVELPYTIVSGSFVPGLNSTIQLSRSSTMRWEG